MNGPAVRLLLGVAVAFAFSGCSLRRIVVNEIGDSLAGPGLLASEEDFELARDAAPFGLKLLESLSRESPGHVGILTSLASGFTQYAYAFVLAEADRVEAADRARGLEMRKRGRRLLFRAREYGLAGLEARLPGFREALRPDPGKALKQATAADVPLLYWTAAPWALAAAADKGDMETLGDLQRVEAMIRRALELDADWGEGTLHEFMVSYEARGDALGGSFKRAREHLDRALALSRGKRVGVLVSWAESACVATQDKKCFVEALDQVLSFDVHSSPENRLANVVAQRRARWLKARLADLFLVEG